MRALLALALVLLPTFPLVAAQDAGEASAWSDPRPFRLRVEIGALRDPLEGRLVAEPAREQLVLVPLDVTAALREAGTWPFDGAGRPLAWTFAPESVRVVADGSDATIPARFLPYGLASGQPDYDASANAAGTLALVLPPGARRLEVYFDIAEHPPRKVALSAEASARLDEIAGLSPWVATLAHVPRTPPGAAPALSVLVPEGSANVRIQRLQPGAPASVLAEASIALHRSIDLPPTEQGYDVLVTSDRPILATLRTSATAGGAFFHAALDGTAAGDEFLLAIPGRAHVIGTRSGTSVSVADAASGATLSTTTLGRLAALPVEIPAGALRRITSSAPILVLQQGDVGEGVDAFLHVGRSIGGEATGALAIAARGAGHAALASAPTTAQAFPLASPQDVASARVGESARPAWVARSAAPAASEPWGFSAQAPLSILTGSDGYAPLAGAEGRSFDVAVATSREPGAPAEFPIQARILVPFDGTHVEVDRSGLDGEIGVSGAIEIGARGVLTTVPGTSEDVANESSILRVRADKPVLATLYRPGAAAAAALPGLPPIATTSSIEIEHFGALLSWSPAASFLTARAGETTRVALTLANLGRTREGEGIVENVALEARPLRSARCRADWEASFPEASIEGLASPGQREVEVLVAVPEVAAPGDCLELEIAARSSFDPSIQTIARATIRARSGFLPELDVVRADGGRASSTSVSLEPGVASAVELRLRNAGGENGTAIVRHARAPGYESRLVARPGGEPVERVEVAGGEEKRLWLELRAPTGNEPAWDFVIQAASAADPAARDDVVVTATPRMDLRLQATSAERRILVTPAGSARTTIDVANLGGDVELRARVAGALPEGWVATIAPERILLRAAGSRDDLGGRLDAAVVDLELAAPAGARVGDAVPIAIELASAGDAIRVPLLALVANDLRLDATIPPTIAVGPRDEGVAIVELRSRAPGAMNVTLRSVAAPTGWSVEASERTFRLAPGETTRLTLRYAVEGPAPPGPGTIALDLQLEDGLTPPRASAIEIPALTQARASIQLLASPARVVLAPGEVAPVLFTIANVGNVPATIEPVASGSLRLDATSRELPPGGTLEILARAGPGIGQAALAVGDARAAVEVVAALRDVRIVSVEERIALGARYLDVGIENLGTIPTGPLRLDLAAGGAPLASVELPGLREGERADHTVLAPATGAIELRVGSSEDLPDANAADNHWSLEGPAAPEPERAGLAAAQRALPAPGPLVALAIALAILLLRRRSR